MDAEDAGGNPTTLAPDEAFDVLGNDTRMEILQTLSEADTPLTFSELYDRVEYNTTANFNYHLDKLVGHFVRKTNEGYTLRQAGLRVVEAVLSGAVTEARVVEPTQLDAPCPYCGAAIEVSYREERVLVRCTECVGSFAGADSTSDAFGTLPGGTLTLNYLPSAGIRGRTPRELLDASVRWTHSPMVSVAIGICSRCSATVDHSVTVCDDHETEGVCDRCHKRFGVMYTYRCPTCNFERRGGFSHHLLREPSVRAFFEARNIDPVTPAWEDVAPLYTYEEEVLGTDPFEARFTFTVAGDDLVVTVDGDLITVDRPKSTTSTNS